MLYDAAGSSHKKKKSEGDDVIMVRKAGQICSGDCFQAARSLSVECYYRNHDNESNIALGKLHLTLKLRKSLEA